MFKDLLFKILKILQQIIIEYIQNEIFQINNY